MPFSIESGITPSVVFIWAHPRSCSTALERAFLQCADTLVLNEPMSMPWFYGKDRVTPRPPVAEPSEEMKRFAGISILETWREITRPRPNQRVIVKELAKYIFCPSIHAPKAAQPMELGQGNPTLIPMTDLFGTHILHCFLVRDPALAVPSLAKVANQVFGDFRADEVGMNELRRLYDLVKIHAASPPLVISADVLLQKPAVVMEQFCQHIDFPYSPSMLHWPVLATNMVTAFDASSPWHQGAAQSTGFRPSTQQHSIETESRAVQDAILYSKEDYAYLLSKCKLAGIDAISFTKHVLQQKTQILLASIPQFHVVRSELIDTDSLNSDFDLLLLIHGTGLPHSVERYIRKRYVVSAGVPSRLVSDFAARNKEIRSRPAPPLTGSLDSSKRATSSQSLAYSRELEENARKLFLRPEGKGPVTQLNIMAFRPGAGKESYHQYGARFSQIGAARGGDAKIMGNVIESKDDSRNGRSIEGWWHEIALAHYPSITHFCDMAAGDDYREINEQYRLPGLKDTVLICTTELDLAALQREAKL